ncbi:MAG: carbamoyl-phosphate synthase large subunit, partial [Planctomycetes bacterium]|nr:carbamoyl-phosphate synthase large subunit [Planctomycetota bacterium]
DYDTSDQLYFEPLTVEDVLNVCEALSPVGLIVQYGGQTPLNLARGLQAAGQKILGTSVEEIDLASSREKFSLVLKELGLRQPANGSANNFEEALAVAEEIGYPVVVRPSYVLGGRAMEIVFDRTELERYMRLAVEASPERPVLVDRFIEDATEVDVDAVADGKTCRVGGIMEHVEEAGVHSGDSCCVLPPPTLPVAIVEEIRRSTYALAARLGVKGLMNIQFAIRGDRLYVLEVNPRASRTVPFVSKATGVPLAKIAARVMAGLTLEEAGFPAEEPWPAYYSVKEPVFPFARFPGCDVLLGPEMRSTGEVMGVDVDLGRALAKAKLGAGQNLPREGRIFLSVKDADKREAYSIARQLHEMGYVLAATGGTHRVLTANGIPAERVHKLHEGRPHVLDLVKNRQIDLIINTPSGRDPKADEAVIRAHAVDYGIPLITNIHAAAAAVDGMEALRRGELRPVALQDLYAPPRGVPPRVGAATPSAAR